MCIANFAILTSGPIKKRLDGSKHVIEIQLQKDISRLINKCVEDIHIPLYLFKWSATLGPDGGGNAP